MRRRPEIARRERFGIDQSASIQAELRRRTQVRVIDILSSIRLDRAMRRNVRESEHFAASEHSLRLALSIGRIPETLTIMGISPL
jgi:hypothetical protein